MDRNTAIKKLKAYVKNPELIKEPTVSELSDLVLVVLGAVSQIESAIKEGRLDGYTPQKDKDYLSIETAQNLLRREIDLMLSQANTVLSETSNELEKRVQQAVQNIRNGNDGIVTDEEIARAAVMAQALIELPDFDALVTGKIQENGGVLVMALESLPEGDEQLRIEAIQGLKTKLEELENKIQLQQVGGVSRNAVLKLIAENTSTGSSTFLDLTDTPSSYSGQAGKAVVVNGTADGIEFQDFPAGSGDVTAASAFVNDNRVIRSDGASKGVQASAVTLDDSGNFTGVGTVNTHTIPGGTGTFALTSQLHDAVTVTDSSEINFTLTGQDITASIVAGSIDETKLDVSTNASLDLADSAVQPTSTNTLTNKTIALGSNTVSGTKAQFDTAVTDGNFLYVGDITQYTDELAQDAVGGMAANSTFINLTYSDVTPSLTPALSATGTPSATTYLRGDNTWATIAAGGDVTKVGTPVNNQVGVWTGDGTIEGDDSLTWDASSLIIDKTGTEALLVRKDADAGDVLTVDTTNARVKIGTPDPNALGAASWPFSISGNALTSANIGISLFTADSTAGGISSYKARGTQSSPTATQADDYLLINTGRGYGSTTFPSAGRGAMSVRASQTWTDANQGTYIGFETTPDNSTTRAERVKITSLAILPTTDDAITLGNTTNRYSDLYLAEGGTINWDNGDAVVTQTGNDITVSGITTFGLGTSTALTTGTIELGAVSDTTITRSSAGVIAVEGVTVPLNSTTNIHTAQQIELGHASDTTISRVSAGVVAVEGNNVILANTAATRSMVLTASGGQPTTTSGCAAVAKVEAGTNDIDYNVLDFDATAQEYAFWNARLPDNYDGGTITARFVWTSSAGGAGGTVVWGIQALAIGNDDAIDAAYGTAQEVSDDWIANGDIHITSATSAITIAGTPAAGDMLMVRVYRDPADANDDLTGDARLMQVVLEYGINAYSE